MKALRIQETFFSNFLEFSRVPNVWGGGTFEKNQSPPKIAVTKLVLAVFVDDLGLPETFNKIAEK